MRRPLGRWRGGIVVATSPDRFPARTPVPPRFPAAALASTKLRHSYGTFLCVARTLRDAELLYDQ
jgi:hypothetical protein